MPSPTDVVFGQVLQELRRRRGLSQEQLGFESGYHRTYVSLLERGKKSPSLNAVFRLARALRVLPSTMLRSVEVRLGDATERQLEKET